MTSSYSRMFLRTWKLRSSTFRWARSTLLVSIGCSIASPSFMPSVASIFMVRSPANIFIRSSSRRDEEPRRALVALAAGAAAELVVDAAGLVPLGADDVQAADVLDVVEPAGCGAAGMPPWSSSAWRSSSAVIVSICLGPASVYFIAQWRSSRSSRSANGICSTSSLGDVEFLGADLAVDVLAAAARRSCRRVSFARGDAAPQPVVQQLLAGDATRA